MAFHTQSPSFKRELLGPFLTPLLPVLSKSRSHKSDVRRKPCNRRPLVGQKSFNRPTSPQAEKNPIISSAYGVKIILRHLRRENDPCRLCFRVLLRFMHFRSNCGPYGTKLSVLTLKCWFKTSGKRFEIVCTYGHKNGSIRNVLEM